MNILLVDDDPMTRILLKKVLEKNDHHVETASDGADALTKLDGHTFDIVVLDGEMPVLNGFETAAHIRNDERYRNLPLLLLSGFTEDTRDTSDFNRVLNKPVGPMEFLLAVEETAISSTH
jgi:CheY-like chemotaxis protein